MTPQSNVLNLLEDFPAARDDENLLVGSVWCREMEFKHINLHKTEVYRFMGMLMEGMLTTASEILDIKYDIQLNQPELRGRYWEERPHNVTLNEIDPDE